MFTVGITGVHTYLNVCLSTTYPLPRRRSRLPSSIPQSGSLNHAYTRRRSETAVFTG